MMSKCSQICQKSQTPVSREMCWNPRCDIKEGRETSTTRTPLQPVSRPSDYRSYCCSSVNLHLPLTIVTGCRLHYQSNQSNSLKQSQNAVS